MLFHLVSKRWTHKKCFSYSIIPEKWDVAYVCSCLTLRKVTHSKLDQQYILKMYFANVSIDVPLIYQRRVRYDIVCNHFLTSALSLKNKVRDHQTGSKLLVLLFCCLLAWPNKYLHKHIGNKIFHLNPK